MYKLINKIVFYTSILILFIIFIGFYVTDFLYCDEHPNGSKLRKLLYKLNQSKSAKIYQETKTDSEIYVYKDELSKEDIIDLTNGFNKTYFDFFGQSKCIFTIRIDFELDNQIYKVYIATDSCDTFYIKEFDPCLGKYNSRNATFSKILLKYGNLHYNL